ncbi:MAG TPA: glycosyltransferase family 39 protein [Pyrinomonadaceae bacterium]|nr:glycosyltransferase family 39 protein [Pyrinomonadaceae bacterium]
MSTLWHKAREKWPGLGRVTRRGLLIFLLIFALAFTIRSLTAQFMRAHLHDAGWFQYGSYAVFDEQARAVLDGRQRLFWIDDPTRTDLVQYPPAFPLWVAAVYIVTGEQSMYAVQRVQWVLDTLLITLLITGIGVTAYGWRAGLAASLLAAFSPLLAMYGATPSADAPTTWFVLGGAWLLLVAAKKRSLPYAIGAGVMLGAACWFRVNPLYLSGAWALALLFFVRADWRQRIALSAAVAGGALLVISPIMIRNYLVFPEFTPTGGTIGVNLWEGLGETELGRSYGFMFGDDKMIEKERVALGLPPDFPIKIFWPDGIRRDRERVRESMAFIKVRPLWYAGVMLERMWGMLKVAGSPLPYYGSAGINVTSQKCLPTERQGGVFALFVNLLGMAQSVVRYLFLPLAALGLWLAARRDFRMTALLLATVLYYLVPGSAAHTEIRYVLPMHGLLTVFAGLGLCLLAETVFRFRQLGARKGKGLAAGG